MTISKERRNHIPLNNNYDFTTINEKNVDLFLELELKEGIIEIPDGTKEILDNAFTNSILLKSITFPGSIKYIGGHDTFANCINLENVHFIHNENTIVTGSHIFENCPKLKSVYFDDWGTFWNYQVDTMGSPLSNGADLYVDNVLINSIIIPKELPRNANIRSLQGSNIEHLSFYDGSEVIAFNHRLTKKHLLLSLLTKYPGLNKILRITENVNEILENAQHNWIIYEEFDDVELAIFNILYYELQKISDDVVKRIYDIYSIPQYSLSYYRISRHYRSWCDLFWSSYSKSKEDEICSWITEEIKGELNSTQLRKIAIEELSKKSLGSSL